VVYILSTFNNTIVTITDIQGNVLSWQTAGCMGFKGSRKSTPYAAQLAAKKALHQMKEYGLKSVEINVSGPGPGRESVIRIIGEICKIVKIVDKTSIPHNGCRPKKERRV